MGQEIELACVSRGHGVAIWHCDLYWIGCDLFVCVGGGGGDLIVG